MLNEEIDWEKQFGKLRSGKRYKLEEKKRTADGKCKKYIEKGYNAVPQSDSENYNNEEEKPETPHTSAIPEV